MTGILIYAGTKNETYSRKTRELLTGARAIANILNETICMAVPDGTSQPYNPNAHCAGIKRAAQTASARVVILYGDTTGKDIAPRLAWRMQAAIITDVVAIQPSADNSFHCIRMAYGGKTEVTMAPRFPLVLTLKPKAFEPIAHGENQANAEEIRITLVPQESGLRLTELQPSSDDSSVKLEDAPVVVSGGRGIRGPEGFQNELRELAQILHGAVGASRAATDAGWTPDSMQVGQTGKTVSPILYFAIGISGATQHIAGMSGSKTIVAVNNDPNAPIFKAAHLGVVSDWKRFLPAFITACKTYLGEKQ